MPDLPTPERGEVIFHARCEPALTAGDYTLRVDHTLQHGGSDVDVGGRPLPPERVFGFTLDAPRFTLDASQIHGIFPPTNGVGNYVSRLPMIVLRRRTLPWERRLAPGSDVPWLAVLLLEKGEATTLSPCTVRQVLQGAPAPGSPTLALPDVPAAALDQPCMGLELPLELFREIAPMASEIGLLTHARQVNTEDKELLGLDEDGWFAVVVGNRLPEPGKSYDACLVSLEGAQAFLPSEADAAELTAADLGRRFEDAVIDRLDAWAGRLVADDPAVDHGLLRDALQAEMLRSGSVWAWINDTPGGGVGGSRSGTAGGAGGGRTIGASAGSGAAQGRPTSAHGRRQAAGTHAWAELALPSTSVSGSVAARDIGRRVGVQLLVPKVRLFLLAQWSFECREGGDFQAIMQALPRNGGVAMLGMPPALAQAPGGVPTSVWRAALDTGHVPLPHLTREGEQTIAWYRGPLTPVGVARETAGPYHCADQARRVDPATGLENLGYAAAFEIGRLLALGDPRFALDLMQWRRGSRLVLDRAVLRDLLAERLPRWADLRLPDLADHRLPWLLPRLAGVRLGLEVGTLMQDARLGALRDPTGLAGLQARLPGLDAGALAEAKGLGAAQARALLGSVALAGSVLEEIGFGAPPALVTDLDVLAADPRRHFAPQIGAFEQRLGRFTRPL